MDRQEFMAQLQRLLWDIPESDRLDAIDYYNNYFDEAGIENEGRVIQELGSPGKVAATIKANLSGAAGEYAEYTERGYYEEGMNQTENPPFRKEYGYYENKRNIPLALIIVLLVFASPLLLGIGGGILGGVLGLLGGVLGVVVSIVVGCAACLLGGIVSLVYGFIRLLFSPAYGLLYLGMGALALAVGIFLLILVLWCVLKWIPSLLRMVVDFIHRILHRNERGTQV